MPGLDQSGEDRPRITRSIDILLERVREHDVTNSATRIGGRKGWSRSIGESSTSADYYCSYVIPNSVIVSSLILFSDIKLDVQI